MSKLRPWLRVSRAAGMKSQSKRKTHSDQLAEDVAQDALRPQCPASEAINPNRQTGARRMKRSTPLAGRVFSGRRTNVKLQPPDWTEDEGPVSTPSNRPVLLAESYVESAVAAFPLGRSPCNRDHAPRFLWSETVVKAKQCNHYYQTLSALKRLWKRDRPNPSIQFI